MTGSPFVLVLAAADDPQLARLRALPHAVVHNEAELAVAPRDAAAIFLWSGSRELLRAALLASPEVRWVHSRAAGLDTVLFPELVASPVALTNGTGVFSPPLGEFALAMMLYYAQNFPRMLRQKAERHWEEFLIEEIGGRTAGIVGYGDIGRAVARRAQAMGMKVLALKRHRPAESDPLVETFYLPAELHAMLERCDYVVASAPLTAETRHMISTAAFAAMKPGAVLINVGRGPVVDQQALITALREGKIRGAGLDVFEQEPIAADDPLWGLENVFISPHTADRTRDWLERSMEFFLGQYERFRRNERLENVVNKQLGY